MQIRQGRPQLRTMFLADAPRPHAFQKAGDRCRPVIQIPQRRAVRHFNRTRTGQAFFRQMVHQTDEERQIFTLHALFI